MSLVLVGFGSWGRNYLSAAKHAGVDIAAIVCRPGSKNSASIRRAADGIGAKVVPYLADAAEYVSGAVIAAHPRAAVDLCEQAFRAGLGVMLEKPAGRCLEDAERIAHLEAEYTLPLLVNHQHLFAAQFERLCRHAWAMNYVDGVASFGGVGPFRDYSALWDYGPHAVSAAIALQGRSTIVTRMERGEFGVSGARGKFSCRVSNERAEKIARVEFAGLVYDGYETAEPPLTRALRAFRVAVKDGGTEDWRFGARWAVDVARVLEAAGAG